MVSSMKSESEVNSFLQAITATSKSETRTTAPAEQMPEHPKAQIKSADVMPARADAYDRFSEVDEALKAILRTTEDLSLDAQCDPRRDSGVCMRNDSTTSFGRRCSSGSDGSRHADAQAAVTDGRKSCSDASSFGRLPSISEKAPAVSSSPSAVFKAAAQAQKLKISPFSLDEHTDRADKRQQTSFVAAAPVRQHLIKGLAFRVTSTCTALMHSVLVNVPCV